VNPVHIWCQRHVPVCNDSPSCLVRFHVNLTGNKDLTVAVGIESIESDAYMASDAATTACRRAFAGRRIAANPRGRTADASTDSVLKPVEYKELDEEFHTVHGALKDNLDLEEIRVLDAENGNVHHDDKGADVDEVPHDLPEFHFLELLRGQEAFASPIDVKGRDNDLLDAKRRHLDVFPDIE
jgi:hypothetical protein